MYFFPTILLNFPTFPFFFPSYLPFNHVSVMLDLKGRLVFFSQADGKEKLRSQPGKSKGLNDLRSLLQMAAV